MKRTRLERRTRLRRANPERRARLHAKQFGAKAEWIRSLGCLRCGWRPCDAAHARSRGAGGTAEHLVPLCWWCHGMQHRLGIDTFNDRFGVDLMAEAERLDAEWREDWP